MCLGDIQSNLGAIPHLSNWPAQIASTHQSGVCLPTLHTGDLNPLQSVWRDFEIQPRTKKDSKPSQWDCYRTFLSLLSDVMLFSTSRLQHNPTLKSCSTNSLGLE